MKLKAALQSLLFPNRQANAGPYEEVEIPGGMEVVFPNPDHFDYDQAPAELPTHPDIWQPGDPPQECPWPSDIPVEIPSEFPGKIEERPLELPHPDICPGPTVLPGPEEDPVPGVIFDWG